MNTKTKARIAFFAAMTGAAMAASGCGKRPATPAGVPYQNMYVDTVKNVVFMHTTFADITYSFNTEVAHVKGMGGHAFNRAFSNLENQQLVDLETAKKAMEAVKAKKPVNCCKKPGT
jgi:hypothetical protein